MNTDQLARTTFVLQRETHEQLNRISRRLGVSRSVLVRDVLAEPVALMDKWMASVPPDATADDVGAARDAMQGDLVEFIARLVDGVPGLGDGSD